MITKEVIDYVKSSMDQGNSLEEIISNLEPNGWTREEITEAYTSLQTNSDTAAQLNNGDVSTPASTVGGDHIAGGKLFKIILIVVVLVGVTGGSFWLYSFSKEGNLPDEKDNVELVNEEVVEMEDDASVTNTLYEKEARLLFSIPGGMEKGYFRLAPNTLDFTYHVQQKEEDTTLVYVNGVSTTTMDGQRSPQHKVRYRDGAVA